MPDSTKTPSNSGTALTVIHSNPEVLVSAFNRLELPEGVFTTPTGMVFTREITSEEWSQVGDQIVLLGKALFWWIGDWLIYGKNLHEATEEQRDQDKRNLKRAEYGILQRAADKLGYSPGYLSNVRSACLRVKLPFRTINLTGSHAIEILNHVPDSQLPFWAKRISDEGLSVRQLRGHLRDHNRTENRSPMTTRPSLFSQEVLAFVRKFQSESSNWSPAEWIGYQATLEPLLSAFSPEAFEARNKKLRI